MKKTSLYLVLFVLVGCQTRKYNSSVSDANKPVKIVLFGDIQLVGEYRETLSDQPMDVTAFTHSPLLIDHLNRYQAVEAIRAEKPEFIINSGDVTDLNNSQQFVILDKNDVELERLKWNVDEYGQVLQKFEGLPPVYPSVGNHESYGLMEFVFNKQDNGQVVWKGPKLGLKVNALDGAQRQASIQQNFPHLKDSKKVTFLPESGTYFLNEENWCLLSVDTNSMVAGDDSVEQVAKAKAAQQSAIAFVKTNLPVCKNKPIIGMAHFPFFSGLRDEIIDKKNRKKRVVELADKEFRKEWVDLMDSMNVALFVGAHEHFYTRYFPTTLKDVGYGDTVPRVTTYLNTGTFGGSFVDAGSERAIEAGRLNNPDVSYASVAETEMAKQNNKLLRVSFEPTYLVIQTSPGSIVAVSKTFDPATKTWNEFDRITLDLKDGVWAPRTAP